MFRIFLIFSCYLIIGCNLPVKKTEDIHLRFLDEFILPNDLMVDSTLVGGLSGIDFHNEIYYIVCDDDKNPRFYKTQIEIKENKIENVEFLETVLLEKTDKRLDLESIAVDSVSNDILLVSEGDINKEKDPAFIRVNNRGELLRDYSIPDYFLAKSKQQPRHNGVFESLTRDFDNKGYWIATELPLKADGPKPKFKETTSPVRVTFFDKGLANKQFVYLLDKIGKKPLGDFAVNGITDMLAYDKNKLLIIERSYSSGYGDQGNVIKLYSVDYTNAVNTLNIKKLKRDNYLPVNKELVLNFENVRDQLTNKSIDNIEGLCFGPTLPNGNKSIVFISDNDFNKQGNRKMQIILMELID